MREYVTVQGDTWDIVSLKVYASEMHLDKLIEANAAYREIVIFPAELKLLVPNISVSSISSTAPPWKRGEA